MALRPGSEAQANPVHTPRLTLQARGLQTLRLLMPGACTWAACLFAQRGGGRAALWSNCWRRGTQMPGSD